jgi:autotransporter adhesin
VAIGRTAKAQGDTSLALGEAQASGVRSVAIGTTTSSGKGATGTYAVAIGYNSASTGTGSVCLGPENTSSSQYSVAIGRSNTASGNYAAVIGSRDSTASADNSFASGQEAKATIRGQKVHASGQFAAKGDAQGSMFILRADTTDATATVLTTNNSTASTDNQIVAASDTCIMFSGTLVAMQNGAQDQGGWEIKGLLKNDGGTTTLVSSNIQTFDDGNGWVVALSADNTNNALAITCTGEASHNIRWVANIQTSEVTYA